MNIRRKIATLLDSARRAKLRNLPRQNAHAVQSGRPKVLLLGVYLSGRDNTAAWLCQEFASSRLYQVEQRWAVIGECSRDPLLAAQTRIISADKVARSVMLNRLLSEMPLADYEYLVVCDDDIVTRRGFLDRFLSLQYQHQLALAQPARTANSWIDHPITCQQVGAICRYTRFVEIGPLFSVHRSLFQQLLPLDTTSPMGWGLDFVWPCLVEAAGLQMGIIDATPVDHSLRQPKTGYASSDALAGMQQLWAKFPHLTPETAHKVLKTVWG